MGTGFDAKHLPAPDGGSGQRRIDRENRKWLQMWQRFADEWSSGEMGDNVRWGHALYGWAENQRKRKKTGQMPSWKQELLESIAFPWKGGRNYADITETRIEELHAFYVRYEHFRVTQRTPGCRRLYLWLERLRAHPRAEVVDRIRRRIRRFRIEHLDGLPGNRDLVTAPEDVLLPGPWHASDETSPFMAGWFQTAADQGCPGEMRWYGVDGEWHPSSTSDAVLPSPPYWRGCHSALELPIEMLAHLKTIPTTDADRYEGMNRAVLERLCSPYRKKIGKGEGHAVSA